MVIQRKKFNIKKRHVKVLWWAVRRWYLRLKFEKFVQYHKKRRVKTTRSELKTCGAARKIQKEFRKYIDKKRRKLKVCLWL